VNGKSSEGENGGGGGGGGGVDLFSQLARKGGREISSMRS